MFYEKKVLDKILMDEKDLYLENNEKSMRKKRHNRYMIWKYLRCFRLFQYYYFKRKVENKRFLRYKWKILCRFYEKKKNIIGQKVGIEIGANCNIGKNLDIWHSGVVINADIGNECTFHGNNILGNKGKGRENETPVVGDGVDFGAGAVAIGRVEIAKGCKIGANAVVTKSIKEPNSIVVGIPGVVIKSKRG